MTTASTQLDAAALRELLDGTNPPRLLDVRTPGEFVTSHIAGSYNVPLETLKEHRDELRNHLDSVVLICRTGGRAAQAEEAFAQAGLTNVHVLDGGIVAWEAAGNPLERTESKRWEMDRQVRGAAGTLVLTGVLGSLFLHPMVWIADFVGAGLTFSAITNTCGMAILLSKLPYNRGPRCDFSSIIEQLSQDGPVK